MLALIEYDVYIGGNGQMQILQQGKLIPPVRIEEQQDSDHFRIL